MKLVIDIPEEVYHDIKIGNTGSCSIRNIAIYAIEKGMVLYEQEQKPSRDMEEIKEVMEYDADAETKCKMISNILTAKPHYFEKQEPILDKVRAEIEELKPNNPNFKGYFEQNVALNKALEVIDKYKAKSEDKI